MLVMESREEMVMLAEGGQRGKSGPNLTEAIGSPVREAQGKPGHRSCLSPGSAPYSRDRTELVMEESARRSLCSDMRPVGTSSSGERHRADHHRKDGSSSDTESDFYEEIDVSCTPESMDYPTAKGRFRGRHATEGSLWFKVIECQRGLSQTEISMRTPDFPEIECITKSCIEIEI